MVAVGDPFLGYVVTKLLDEVLKALILVKTSSKNADRLWNLLERLQPSVKKLSSIQDQNHPAGKWLTELHQQLEECLKLANNHRNVQRNILRRYQTSRTALTLYASIQRLLQEAAVHQWAYGLSINSILVEHNVKILEELTITQERDEQLLRSSAELTSKVDLQSIMTGPKQVSSSKILDGSSSSAVPLDTLPMNYTCDVPKPQVTFGGEAVANSIINHLLHEEYRKWVGLWGMGGIGKTFTATKVFHDPRVQRHFSGGMFWITVSKDQPSLNHLFKQLLEKVKGPNSISQLPRNVDAAKSYLADLLDRDRVLLVLDDVWQSDVTRYFDVVSEHRKGVVLVTTRDRDILKQAMDFGDIYETPRLSEEDSWQLFAWHAFHSRGRPIAPDVEVVARMVAEECRGLPLALSVIGSTMASKEVFPDEIALGATLLREYEIALERLQKANHAKNEYEDLFSKLQLSVDSLRDEDCRLQDCFFYFAAFREDEEVYVEDLVNMWNAEGLVQGDVSGVLSGKEVGKILLRILVAKAMIEVKWGAYCKIHDVMRDVAQRNLKRNVRSGEEITASGRACLYAPGLRDCRLPEEWISSGVTCSAKRLSLRGNDFRQFPEPEHFNAPHLELLILSRNSKLHLLAPRFFQSLPNLKVLDLSRTGIVKICGALLERLKSLVLLNLEGCSELQEISDKIDRLQCLEYLFLDNCKKLQKLPRVENLLTLKLYRVQDVQKKVSKGAGADCRFWKSWHPWWTRGVPYLLPPNLRELRIVSKRRGFSGIDKYSFHVSSLGSLEELTLTLLTSLPAGLEQLRALKFLDIYCPLNGRAPALGELPLLRDLSIQINNSDGTEAFGHKGAFPSLRNLSIECRMKKMFIFHPGTMPKIESLHITMKKREHFPSSITELSTLKRLSLQLDPGSTHFSFSGERVEIGGRFYHRPAYVRDEDIELLFCQENCFPALEFLSIREACSERPVVGGRVQYRDAFTKWPKRIVDRQKTGSLVIEGFRPSTAARPVKPSTAARPVKPSTAARPVKPSTAARPVKPSTAARPVKPWTASRPVPDGR